MAWGLPALEAEAKTMKAMKTLAAKAMRMTPETNTKKAMKTPAAKAKGMKPETKTMKAMKTPAAEENMKARRASAAKVDAERSVGTDWGVAAIEEGGARDHEVVAAGEAVRADISEPSCNQ